MILFLVGQSECGTKYIRHQIAGWTYVISWRSHTLTSSFNRIFLFGYCIERKVGGGGANVIQKIDFWSSCVFSISQSARLLVVIVFQTICRRFTRFYHACLHTFAINYPRFSRTFTYTIISFSLF